mgnify:CR=1 FL=1
MATLDHAHWSQLFNIVQQIQFRQTLKQSDWKSVEILSELRTIIALLKNSGVVCKFPIAEAGKQPLLNYQKTDLRFEILWIKPPCRYIWTLDQRINGHKLSALFSWPELCNPITSKQVASSWIASNQIVLNLMESNKRTQIEFQQIRYWISRNKS